MSELLGLSKLQAGATARRLGNGGFHGHGGSPKWLVNEFIRENPIRIWMMTGGSPNDSGKLQMFGSLKPDRTATYSNNPAGLAPMLASAWAFDISFCFPPQTFLVVVPLSRLQEVLQNLAEEQARSKFWQ